MNRNILKKINTTLKNEGVYSAFKKSYLRLRYIYLRNRSNNSLEIKKWKNLKDKYKGQRVFLIGNGPSLNKTKLYYLEDEYILCFNRFQIMSERLNWLPTFYMVTDNLVLNDMLNEVESISAKVDYSFYPDIHFRGANFKSKINNQENILWLEQKHGQNFSVNLPKVHLGGSVIYEGFQVLNYLGFDEVYFIGVDMNFKIHETVKEINGKQTDIESKKDDDPNHFDPRYFGKNRKYHQPKEHVVQLIMNNLKYLSKIENKLNMNIFNAGYDSKVDYFQRVNFDNLFNYSEDKKKALINECFSKNTDFESVNKFRDQAIYLESNEHWSENISDFYTTMDEGLKLITKAIFTHIPLGPYKEEYYFVKRT